MKAQGSAVLLAVALAVSSQASLAGVLSKIECTGQTTDNRAARVVVETAADQTAYPVSVAVTTQLGADAPVTASSRLSSSSGVDVTNKTVFLFKADLGTDQVFAARTYDMKTGVGALHLKPAVRAPMMNCTFTEASAR
jgi:hypothetical protein